MSNFTEAQACTPHPAMREHLNPDCSLPYDLDPEHVFKAMGDFLDFLGFVNQQLHMFPNDAVHYAHEGVEIKASRHASGWQGHNPEAIWLIVFHFDSNSASDARKLIAPKPFRFQGVYAARLEKSNWAFSGRSAQSRRTITASVTGDGAFKMRANWIYRDLGR